MKIRVPSIGEIWLVRFPDAHGHQQGGTRPFIVTSNNKQNLYSPTLIGVALSSNTEKLEKSPSYVLIEKSKYPGLHKNSIALCHQPRVPNINDFVTYLDTLDDEDIEKIAYARAKSEIILIRTSEAKIHSDPEFTEYNNYKITDENIKYGYLSKQHSQAINA